MTLHRHTLLIALLALMLAAPNADAIVTVGPKTSNQLYTGCQFQTIQDAINYVQNNEKTTSPYPGYPDGADVYIGIAGAGYVSSSVFTGYWPGVYYENLVMSDSGISWPGNPAGYQGLRIQLYGGYDGYCDDTPNGSYTEINASNNSGASVLEVSGNSVVNLFNLRMSGATGVARGGGINFHGQGELHLTNVDVAGNHAEYGAGVFADGSDGPLAVFLHHDTLIEDNSAHTSGGGIRMQRQARLFALEPNISIVDNIANPHSDDGAGGGLELYRQARADLGSITIARNLARVGGGIALLVDTTDKAVVRMFRTDPSVPVRISNNTAWSQGGGIYNTAHSSGDTYVPGLVCASGTSIDANYAADGAALYANGDTDFLGLTTIGGYFDFRIGSVDGSACGPEPASQLGALGCLTGSACNTIDDNRSQDSAGNPTNGATVNIQADGVFQANHIELRRNHGGQVFHGYETGQLGDHLMNNCLVAENEVSGDLLHTQDLSSLKLDDCTIAYNTIAGTNVISVGSPSIRRSIVWQPGNTVLAVTNGTRQTIADVLVNEVDSLGGADASLIVADPQFVAPASGDFHLSQTSPAVDFAASDGVSATELDGFKRNVDLPIQNRAGGGPVDLGAYELQTYVPPPPPPTCVVSDTVFCNAFEPTP